MKLTVRTDEITLSVNGQEMTFSGEKLTSILEEYFKLKESKETNVAQKPTEGKWFKVTPLSIDQNLFREKRWDSRQEDTRQLILRAFKEMKKNSKYARPFKTMIPEKNWLSLKTGNQLKALAIELGGCMANWIEQALEWAQRIANGEKWEDICNKADTAKCYRVIVWKYGCITLIGGSCNVFDYNSSSNVCKSSFKVYDDISYDAVPLVACYE